MISVAPLVGAWIETSYVLNKLMYKSSHPSWVRGLKLRLYPCPAHDVTSHPSWVRGLKLRMWKKTTTNTSRTPRGCVD